MDNTWSRESVKLFSVCAEKKMCQSLIMALRMDVTMETKYMALLQYCINMFLR